MPAAQQRSALAALLECLAPRQLTLRGALRAALNPPAFGYSANGASHGEHVVDVDESEWLAGRTGAVFDALAPADAVATLVLSKLLGSAARPELGCDNIL